MLFRLTVLATALVVASPASADLGTSLSPRLRMVARGQLPAHALAASGGSRALVTVRVRGGAERLRALGLAATPLTDEIAAAELDAAALAWLAGALPGEAISIEERHVLRPQLDRAAAAIGAPAARAATGLSGRGALVGVVDGGIDLRHDDVRRLDGSTRVMALLDRRTPPDGRHAALGEFGGAVWHKEEIDALLAAERLGLPAAVAIPQRDLDGHGTHVATIAAGNGRAGGNGAPGGRYVGIAPEADLLIAQASDENGAFTDVSVLAACRFLVAEQRALGRPLVVNLSLGGAGGPHDGNTNVEVAFDELFPREAAGRVLVVAAGNDGGRDVHAGGWALDGEVALPLSLREGVRDPVALEAWYRGELAIAVESPGGRRTAFVDAGLSLDVTLAEEGRVLIDNAPRGPLASGRRGAGIVLENGQGGAPALGTWRVVLRGRSIRYDAWLLDSPTGAQVRFAEHVIADDHLSVPATARSAISVGSLRTRLDWFTVEGTFFQPPGAESAIVGGPSPFSAAGPTSDGRLAPDVAAPGEFVIAALSRDAPPAEERSSFHVGGPEPYALVAEDGVHAALRGTSQAAPVVAGVIALLLEAAPELTSEAVRELLRTTAAPVAGTAGWSPRVGFGRVDVQAALAHLRGARGVAPSARASRVGVSRDLLPPESEELTLVTVTPRDEVGVALGAGRVVSIELSAGAPVGGVVDVGAGRYERAFVAHAPRGAVGTVRVIVDGVELDAHPRVWFVPTRAELGGDLVAGGGCAYGGGTAEVAPWLLAALGALGLARRRTRTRRPATGNRQQAMADQPRIALYGHPPR